MRESLCAVARARVLICTPRAEARSPLDEGDYEVHGCVCGYSCASVCVGEKYVYREERPVCHSTRVTMRKASSVVT